MRIMEAMPPWLARPAPQEDPKRRQKYERTQRYFLKMWQATPKWLTAEHKKQFYAVYKEMRARRYRGEDVNVDHIVPLCSEYVCGLNVPWNIEIIDARQNGLKNNHWWPDCPWENHELDLKVEPYQQQLRL